MKYLSLLRRKVSKENSVTHLLHLPIANWAKVITLFSSLAIGIQFFILDTGIIILLITKVKCLRLLLQCILLVLLLAYFYFEYTYSSFVKF